MVLKIILGDVGIRKDLNGGEYSRHYHSLLFIMGIFNGI